jgi:hypothetical protein
LCFDSCCVDGLCVCYCELHCFVVCVFDDAKMRRLWRVPKYLGWVNGRFRFG